MRRRLCFWLLLLIGILLCSFFFGKSIFLKSSSEVAKAYLKYSKGWDFNYTSVCWEKQGFVFSDISLDDSACFSIRAKELSISLISKEIHLSEPKVKVDPKRRNIDATTLAIESQLPLKQVFAFLGSKFSPLFKIHVENGELCFGGNIANFTFDATDERAHLLLTDGAFHLLIDQINREDKTFVDLTASQFPLSFLDSLVELPSSGMVDCELHLVKDNALWTANNCTIEAQEICLANVFENVSGKLDFSGPVFGLSYVEMLEKAKFRLNLDEGENPFAENLHGILSFDGQTGAKWDFTFDAQKEKMRSSGRGFFNSLQGRWIDSDFCSENSSVALHLREKDDTYHLNIQTDELREGFLKWMRDVAFVIGAPDLGFELEKGVITGRGQLCFNKSGSVTWEVQDCLLEDITLTRKDLRVSCEKVLVKEGTYSFNGGTFCIADEMVGTNWSGKGDLSTFLGSISGELGPLQLDANYRGNFDLLFASLKIGGPIDGELSLQGSVVDHGFQFAVRDGFGTLFSSYGVESIRVDGEINSEGLSLTDMKGVFDAGKKVPFYAPIIQTRGVFDIRFEKPLFDIARLSGTCKSGDIELDVLRSHVLGRPISQGKGLITHRGVDALGLQCSIPWKVLPFFLDVPQFFKEIGDDDAIECSLTYDKDKDLSLAIASHIGSIDVDLNIHKKDHAWHLESSKLWNWEIDGHFFFDKGGIQITDASGRSDDGLSTHFTGKLSSLDQCDLKLSNLFIDLGTFQMTKNLGIQGILEGEGMIHWKGGFESDFDVTASQVKAKNLSIESEGPLNIYCSSEKGIFVRGLNLSSTHLDVPARCKVDLFQYILKEDDKNLFAFTDAEFDLPSEFLIGLGLKEKVPSFAADFFNQPLQGVADISFFSDFSIASLSMKRASFLFDEKEYTLQNLHFDLSEKQNQLHFDIVHPKRFVPIDLSFQLEPSINGRLTVENGLKVDWSYKDGFCIEAIDGKCSGIEASFQKETDSLIGSARLNGNELKGFLPEKITHVFDELKIGDGYELMGRLSLKDRHLSFRGLLSGKQIELFGYEFKNILGRIEWDANHFLVSDLKVSDFAGVLKIDEILAKQVGNDPWTISIPHIVVTELRPSLLQDVDGPPGEISPLVIRELKIDDFKGLVDDRNTYTAKGELFFINSYKRGTSLLDLPSDFLSRIVGLDLDLLVPVCGSLKYELHDGFFHFTELAGSYSENKRSEFFLSFDESMPKMDLDWNLSLLVEMKQFVLFKFTEAFRISVTGKLDDPKFNLQRKKRFFGVL